MDQYKKAAAAAAGKAQTPIWAVPNFQGNGVYIAPATNTVTTFAASSLTSQ